MPSKPKPRTGGQILIDQLALHGADTVFGVPGESFLAALDALYEARNTIRFISCRQEGGAAFMAEAYAKLTGKPGICFVTRGPGACNASIGIHTGFQDSTPMILLVGQVGCGHRRNLDLRRVERRIVACFIRHIVSLSSAHVFAQKLSALCNATFRPQRGLAFFCR